MLDIEKENYFKKLNTLFDEGVKNGDIIPFDKDLYEKMSTTYIIGIPVSIYIKYLNLTLPSDRGKCGEESLFMFFCFKESILVRGEMKDLKLKEKPPYHGWIEMVDYINGKEEVYVYDPSRLLKFKRNSFYQLYEPTNISRCNIEQYKNISKENEAFYETIQNTTLEDFKPNGRKRNLLHLNIPLLQRIVDESNDEDFQREVSDYLDSIEYNEQQLQKEMEIAFQKRK